MRLLIFISTMVLLFLLSLPGTPQMILGDKERTEDQELIHLHLEDCYTSLGISGREFIIQNQQDFQQLEWLYTPNSFCHFEELPKIDFEIYTLIGQRTATHCPETISRKVFKKENGDLIYQIDLMDNPNCGTLTIEKNWVLIPKIEADTKIDFQINKRKVPNA